MTERGDAVIVTGASSGIGRGCVDRLLECGASVVGIDLAQATARHERYRHVVASVTDEEAIERAVSDTETSLGPIRGLVNAAGVFSAGKSVVDLSMADFVRVVGANLTGTFVVGRAVARRMMAQRRGKIVNVACIRSALVRAGMSDYAASKGGVVSLTSAMAVDLAPHGVQVNAVAPGFTRTGITERSFSDPGVLAERTRLVPLGRVAEPSDIAGPILFLLSRDADYVTGQVLFIDGGFSINK